MILNTVAKVNIMFCHRRSVWMLQMDVVVGLLNPDLNELAGLPDKDFTILACCTC
jgi:hypothetical protein